MDFLKKLALQTKTQLASLSVSQRAAIGLCVIVMVGALGWLLRWSAEPERVPLINQELAPEDLGRIQSRLDQAGVDYRLVNGRILVRPEQRAVWLARLGEQHALPDDLSVSFESLIKDQSPFVNMDEQAWRRQVALGNELAQVLRNFSGVADARVFVDRTEKRGLGRAPTAPTASIYVKMKPGSELDKAKVYALASFVARSVSGLSVRNVGVSDATTGRSYTVPDPSDPGSFDDLDDRRRKEEYFTQKLLNQFAHVPGILVGVHAELDPESKTIESTKYGKPVKAREETESTTQDRGSVGASPGVVANTARTAGGAGTSEKLEKTSASEEYLAGVDKTVETSERMRHGIRSLRASINIPRSYFVSIFKATTPGKEPSDADLDPIIRDQRVRFQKQAASLLGATDESAVQVDWYHDLTPPFAVVAQAGAGSEVLAWARQYGGQAGLGALAVVSLVMMLLIVRRASESPILPGEEPPPKPSLLQAALGRKRPGAAPEAEEETIWVSSTPVGEARVTEGVLVGREVGQEDVRAAQLVEQVSQLIEDDPDVAASLVKRWVESGK